MDLGFFKNRKVLITGHTGFKGSWLTKVLLMAGADVTGYALEPPTEPCLFDEAGIRGLLGEKSVTGDIRDLPRLLQVFQSFQPEFVIHMAAQPLVRASYEAPVLTYETNVMGTVNLLECVRRTPSVKSVLNVTTDKVYENFEWERGYKEDDRLDGYDPYSNSKSCSELVTHSYKRSFLDDTGVAVSTARAGNVIGGGDYAKDRIIPDCIRAAVKGEEILIRNPYSVRPFQHVLEPLSAYLLILQKQYEDPALAGYYNVGPSDKDAVTAGRLADIFCEKWGGGQTWKNLYAGGPHEAGYLKLDSAKIRETLSWEPGWDISNAVEKTVEYVKAGDKARCMEEQIRVFFDFRG